MSAVTTALQLNTQSLTQGVAVANRALESLKTTSKSTDKSVASLLKFEKLKLALGAAKTAANAATGIFGAIANQVTGTAKLLNGQINLATQLGITQAEFVGLGRAAELAGLQAEQLFEPLSKIPTLIASALGGGKDALALFDQLGLSAEKLNGLTPFQRINELTEAIRKIDDVNKQSAILNKVFGESGQRFRAFFAVGAEGFKRLTDEARKLGLAIDEKAVRNIRQLDFASKAIAETVQGIKSLVVTELAPVISEKLNKLNAALRLPEFRQDVVDFFKGIGTLAIEAASATGEFLLTLANNLATLVGDLQTLLNDLKLKNLATGKTLVKWTTGGLIDFDKPDLEGGGGGGGGGWGDEIDDEIGGLGGQMRQLEELFKKLNVSAEQAAAKLNAVPKPNAEAAAAAVKPIADAAAKAADLVQVNFRKVGETNANAVGGADANDVRTAAGMEDFLKALQPGFGASREVQVAEQQLAELKQIKAAVGKKPAPVNL